MYVYMYVCIYVLFYKFSPDNSFSVNNFFLLHIHPTLSNMADISQSPHHTNTRLQTPIMYLSRDLHTIQN